MRRPFIINQPSTCYLKYTQVFILHVSSPATGHLHILFLQPIRPPAPYPHFHSLNVYCSFSFQLKFFFPREAFPDLPSPYCVLSEYYFRLFHSTITASVLRAIEWLFDGCSLSFPQTDHEPCLGRAVSICAHHCIPRIRIVPGP